VDTVLVDQETIYLPRHGDDRLLLGLNAVFDAAHEAGASEDEAVFDENLKRIAKLSQNRKNQSPVETNSDFSSHAR
jgi:hypothetical protein